MKNKITDNISIESILPLKQSEIDLLYMIRHKYQWGPLEIMVNDGTPKYCIKTVERTRLGDLSTAEFDGAGFDQYNTRR